MLAAWVPFGSLLLAMMSFQAGAVLAKHLFPVMGAAGTTALRLSLGACVLWALRRPWRAWPPRSAWSTLAGYGISLGLMNLCFYLSLQQIPLGIALAMEFMGPLSIAIWGSRRLLDAVWIGLALFGLWLLLPWTQANPGVRPIGLVYAAMAAVCWAAYIILGRRAGRLAGSNTVALGAAIGAMMVLPIGVATAGTQILHWELWPYAFGVAIFSSAMPHSLEMTALTRLQPRTVGILVSLEPAIGAVFGWQFLGETLTTSQWLAIAAIMIASIGTAVEAHMDSP